MEVKFTRRTGFYGMGSPIQLRINGQKKVSLNHNQLVKLELEVPFTMQVSFFLLKSPNYTVTHPSTSYLVTMNIFLLQVYPFLFLATGLSAFYIKSFFYSLLVVLFMIGFFIYMKNQAYVIKEENDGER